MTPARASLRDRLSLIVVADPGGVAGRRFVHVVREALKGGAPALQLRAKSMAAREMTELARVLLAETRGAGALLFINDRIDVALAAGADGAHIGDDDIPLAAARGIVPAGFLLGRSADSPDQARTATTEGADYLGVGPVYATQSKEDAGPAIGIAGLSAVAAATSLPVVGIGGITRDTAEEVVAGGAAGIAVIRAVMTGQDPAEEVRYLLEQVARGSGRSSGQ